MFRISIAIFSFISMYFASASAQTITAEEYIDTYKSIAIEEMIRSGVPASITLAQGLLETESGNSDLVRRSNNHFGIKCKTGWQGESVSHTDDAPNECFRKYKTARDSYADHSNFLRQNSRYGSLFLLDKTDYKAWATGLKKAGYATNPRYPQILINHIEKHNLHRYDSDDYDASSNIPTTTTPINTPTNNQTTDDKLLEQSKQANKKFNGLKAAFVQKNTSLLAVATNAAIPLSRLLEYNDLKKDGLLSESQYIYLEKKKKEGTKDFYTTTETESLYDISQAIGIQINYLIKYNQLTEDAVLKPGTIIKLRENTAK